MSSGHVEQSEEAAAVLRMAFAFVISQALYVAADLGIADHLAHGSPKVEDLASKLHVDPGALARLLQALVAFGILKRDGVRFGLSPTGHSSDPTHRAHCAPRCASSSAGGRGVRSNSLATA